MSKLVVNEEKVKTPQEQVDELKKDAIKWGGRAAEMERMASEKMLVVLALRKSLSAAKYEGRVEDEVVYRALLTNESDAFFYAVEQSKMFKNWSANSVNKSREICTGDDCCNCKSCDPFADE